MTTGSLDRAIVVTGCVHRHRPRRGSGGRPPGRARVRRRVQAVRRRQPVLLAVLLRLNKVAILAGAWTNIPWTLAPMLTAGTALGCFLLGVSPASLGAIEWALRGRAFFESLAAGLRPLLLPFVVGNLVLGALAGATSFVVLRALLARRAKGAGAGPGVPGAR